VFNPNETTNSKLCFKEALAAACQCYADESSHFLSRRMIVRRAEDKKRYAGEM
jgi:hypothetical protein